MSKKISGTKEWSDHSVNCVTGCSHDCRYCYAREMAVRHQRVTAEEWPVMKVREKDIHRTRGKKVGTIMFPTTHDITPEVSHECSKVILKMLKAGNNLLIVSKPHLNVIRDLCTLIREFKDQVLFRFTIGSCNDGILKYWEPGAPDFAERFASLKHAYEEGFKTSVSSEPLLDYDGVDDLGGNILPYITDAWWIGKMNRPKNRVNITSEYDSAMLSDVLNNQVDHKIEALYERYKDNPKVKWKESIKSVVGIELPTETGTDE